MPPYVMWISAGPAGSAFGTVSVAVCCASLSDTLAFCVADPAVIVTSRNVISIACRTTVRVGCSICTRIVSVPSKRARARSTAKARS